jgi:hypothetical protein
MDTGTTRLFKNLSLDSQSRTCRSMVRWDRESGVVGWLNYDLDFASGYHCCVSSWSIWTWEGFHPPCSSMARCSLFTSKYSHSYFILKLSNANETTFGLCSMVSTMCVPVCLFYILIINHCIHRLRIQSVLFKSFSPIYASTTTDYTPRERAMYHFDAFELSCPLWSYFQGGGFVCVEIPHPPVKASLMLNPDQRLSLYEIYGSKICGVRSRIRCSLSCLRSQHSGRL